MEKITLDPVKYELLYQKLEAACNEAKDIVQYLSGSTIAREAGEVDCATAPLISFGFRTDWRTSGL